MTTQELQKVNQNSLRCILEAVPGLDAGALYGSAARGDIEEHSDIDILLVSRYSQKEPILEELRRTLSGCFRKLSLTVYSEKELKFLHSAKSLFLLHLSREAIVLLDRRRFLSSLLHDFEPKSSYRSDFEKSLHLVEPLMTSIDGAPNDLHRLSYVYSLFRVFGVYLLAERGIYEFSKSRMANSLVELFPTHERNVELLSSLRMLNSNFFTGGLASPLEESSKSCLLDSLHALTALVGIPFKHAFTSYSEAVKQFDAIVGRERRALDYRLRMWFLLLIYDGINLFCLQKSREPLNDLSEIGLAKLAANSGSQVICEAANETIAYLHRYPLKYFLNEQSKIDAAKARRILGAVSEEVCSY